MKSGTTPERRWRNKLERQHPSHGKIEPIPVKMQKTLGTGTLLIPQPLDVDALMRKPRNGQLITIGQIRRALAASAGADCTCPLTTGIFVRIAAETAVEDLQFQCRKITPYWRTIRDDGSLMEKFPGGLAGHAAKLRQEGFKLEARKGSKKLRVSNVDRHRVKLATD